MTSWPPDTARPRLRDHELFGGETFELLAASLTRNAKPCGDVGRPRGTARLQQE